MRFENIILNILRVLPKSLLRMIAGPPKIIDDNKLDLNIQVVEKLSQKDIKKPRNSPSEYREAAELFDLTGLPRVKGITIKDIKLEGPTQTLDARIYYPKKKTNRDGAVLRQAGDGWKEVQDKIKRGLPPRYRDNIKTK